MFSYGSSHCRPGHVITMLRPRRFRPATHASFKVPLHFNKLEFRDYLHNVYNVQVRSVRSEVLQQKLRFRSQVGRDLYRPTSEKVMHVTLVKPFVWPEVPSAEVKHRDYDKNLPRKKREDSEDDDRVSDRELLAQQARDFLSGKERWKPGKKLGALPQ
jgi:large subunit ribosomal protein L23